MKKMLTSVWFAVALGLMGTGVLVGILWPTDSPETAEPPHGAAAADTNAHPETVEHASTADTNAPVIPGIESKPIVQEEVVPVVSAAQVTEPGALSFNNPEVAQLIDVLKREREELRKKEEQLRELEQRLALEIRWIGTITQKFLEAKRLMEQAMTNQTTVLQVKEREKLQQLAKIYTNMPPSNAVVILSKMPVDDIARILEFMKDQNKAAILESLSTNMSVTAAGGTNITGPQLATDISDRLRRLSTEPNLPATPRIEPPPDASK